MSIDLNSPSSSVNRFEERQPEIISAALVSSSKTPKHTSELPSRPRREAPPRANTGGAGVEGAIHIDLQPGHHHSRSDPMNPNIRLHHHPRIAHHATAA
jgi:hypothetical protein